MPVRTFSCVAVLLFCALGCQPKGTGVNTQFVEGVVTLDDAPLNAVSITFVPKMEGVGENAGGLSDFNGRYTLSSLSGDPGKGALEGEYIILAAKSEPFVFEKPIVSPVSGDEITSELRPVLHEIYQNRQKTPLSATVVKGKNRIDIKLESKPSK